jgi:hypothetical protein
MTPQALANIVFNETRSLSGKDIYQARVNIALSILNAEKAKLHRPLTAPVTASIPHVEEAIYVDCLRAANEALADTKKGTDPTNGATHFNFRFGASRNPFFGFAVHTQIGPLQNSYPTPALPATGIFANTYGN